MAAQPFYHRVDGVLFTATHALSEKEFLTALATGLKTIRGVIKESVEIEPNGFQEPEAGDPTDLDQ